MRIAILGTVGIPAAYGGFETLAENLAKFHRDNQISGELIIYCSALAYDDHQSNVFGAKLHYIKLKANGISSIFYDIVCLASAARLRVDVILLLGVSGAIALPLVRLFSATRIITNIDGLEWRRQKWNGLARLFLRLSEFLAVRCSHEVIADNEGIREYITKTHKRDCHVIPYGGDHAISTLRKPYNKTLLPKQYAFALCRIEPENNIGMILEGFAKLENIPLIFVGNWQNCEYSRSLYDNFSCFPNIYLIDAIYDVGILHTLRGQASIYLHGHSAGGTNPSLVEMMHFAIPILAFDCIYNQYTTEGKAIYFDSVIELIRQLRGLEPKKMAKIGVELGLLAKERYTWDLVGRAYMKVLMTPQS
jgi:glycosyltransferase involved in cell wall biosynthesis